MLTSRPCRVALTGGIASGKSHCLRVFAALGVPTIDADVVARDVVEPGTAGLAAIIARFGPAVLDEHGRLDRAALGRVVFGDPAERRALEAIVHPAVYQAITDWFDSEKSRRVAFYENRKKRPDGFFAIADIPLLFETGHERDFDKVVVAACRDDQQLARLMARDGLDEADARQRLAAQLPLADKAARADYVIDTSGTVEDTDAQVTRVWRALQQACS